MPGTGDVERLAREGAERAGGAEAARALLRKERVGVLSTLSLRHPGWPYGTLVPYALSARGEPLLLLSGLAQHTQNLEADPRATLLVFDGAAAAEDPRTSPRVTLVGRIQRVDAAGEPEARDRYLAWHGSARGLLQLDFSLYALEVDEAQFVGGFAAAGFFPGAALRE
ncbi:MAG TPA: pyridoxamine 5'-phosphate oxidase family protein [Anaeromyxobacteraceae bacterium]|nr:pyridoxamine 5'-phosphate oxidase family protein [Anaeromyxobacteraceae bacterium]